ncbi:MAG: DUF5711 family protein [Negativibacillus sp.]|nr:DUF5711 family protein [Negativibacillus sp.]CDA61142.1 uncharacterized protein BN513_00953 [Clostridium sp. CAG:169]
MAKVTDFKKLKQRQARRRAFKLAGLAGVILAIAYLLSSLVNSPEFAGLSSLGDMIKGGPGYPIDAPGGKIKGMYQNDSGIILLNETTLYIYNTSGTEVYSNLHRMGNPQVQTSGTMMLNYDRGSKTYAAYSRNNLFYNGSTDEAIRCGAISQNGCIAIATQTENAQTRVTVLDSRQREQYVWKTDNVVTALAMSDNGSAVAIASSYAQAGELKNVLTVLKNGQEQNRYELANQLILALEFDGSNVRCITDKNAFILGTEGKIIGQFDYKGQSLAAFAMYENGVALVFGDYEQDRKYTLASVADDFYTLNGTTTFDDSLQKVKAIGNTILVLGGSSFHEYSAYDCELLKEETNESYYDIQPMGNSIYAMTTTQIVRLPLEEPSRFALFSHKEPQQLPDGSPTEQSQQEIDLLQSILDGMKREEEKAQQSQGQELTVGESQEIIDQIPLEDTAFESSQAQEESSEVEEEENEFDPENPDGVLNQGSDHLPVQNEDLQPEFSQEEAPPESETSEQPQQSDKADEQEKQETEDKKQDKEENENKDEPLFSSRRPA